MQYIDQNTTPRTNIQRQNDPTTLEKEWPTTINMPLTIHLFVSAEITCNFSTREI